MRLWPKGLPISLKEAKIPKNMALRIKFKDTEFGVGDRVRVVQKVSEAGKSHQANFDGMVLGIRGRGEGRSFRVRKIAEGRIGVERIFPVSLPTIEKVILIKSGVRGVRRAKLYFTRKKSPTEIEMIYKKAAVKEQTKLDKEPKKAKRAAKKRPVKRARKTG